MSQRKSVSNRSFSYQSKQARIEHQIDQYAKKLEAQRRRINHYQQVSDWQMQQKKQIQQQMKKRKKGIFQYNKSLDSTKSKLAYTMTLNFKKKTDVFHKRNNKTIERINALKSLINKLRFEKRTTKQTVERCEEELADLNRQLQFQKSELNSKNLIMNNAKQEIIGLKSQIEEEESSFVHKFKSLKKQFEEERIRNTKNEGKLRQAQKYNISDTSSLLRRKLQAIIVNNKQKLRMIQSYQKNMRILDDAFTAMKQSSGLTDIKELEIVFIKSEEQNCELLTYLNTLNQQIEKLEDENVQILEKCDKLEEDNEERQELLNRIPYEEIRRQELHQISSKKQQIVGETSKLLADLSPKLSQCLIKLRGTGSKEPQMNMLNYQKVINELQETINKVVMAKSRKLGRNLIEDTSEFNMLSSKLDKKSLDSSYNLPLMESHPEDKAGLMDYEKLKQNALELIKEGNLQIKEKEKTMHLSKRKSSN